MTSTGIYGHIVFAEGWNDPSVPRRTLINKSLSNRTVELRATVRNNEEARDELMRSNFHDMLSSEKRKIWKGVYPKLPFVVNLFTVDLNRLKSHIINSRVRGEVE